MTPSASPSTSLWGPFTGILRLSKLTVPMATVTVPPSSFTVQRTIPPGVSTEKGAPLPSLS